MSERFKDTTTIELGNKTFDIVKKGGAQARQIPILIKWLSKYVLPSIGKLDGIEISDKITTPTMLRLIGLLGETLDDEALTTLFKFVFGCSEAEVEKHFDLLLLVDAIVCLWESESVYREVVSRFFSTTQSE